MSEKVKLFTNPERNKPEDLSELAPQYQRAGIEPEIFDLGTTGEMTFFRPGFNPTPMKQNINKSSIPNVGNNSETFPMNGEVIIDEQELSDVEVVERVEITAFEEDANPIATLKDGSYIILVGGKVLSIGSLNIIEKEVSDLILGTHKEVKTPIDILDITVLKKVNIKVGVFLEK